MLDNTSFCAASSCETVAIRGLSYNIRRWGKKGAKPILMLHGTRDSSITFQFVFDQLEGEWEVVAPDWRGHGFTERAHSYWFHDFVADLSAILDLLFPARAVPLVGHSLGGNVAGIFAGLRPERVSHLISLDGFGPYANHLPVDPVALLCRFLDVDEREGRAYPDLSAMTVRLQQANPRLTRSQAAFLAEHSSRTGHDGRRYWLYTSSFERSIPTFRNLEEWGLIWARITAPVLWVLSDDQRLNAPVRDPEEMARRSALMPHVELRQVPHTSHNLHHDEPAQVAQLIEAFLAKTS